MHPSTAATALVAIGAKIELTNGDGKKRVVGLDELLLLPEKDIQHENDLKSGEILTAILLSSLPPDTRSIHLKHSDKESFDWPTADVAVVLTGKPKGICRHASIVLGAAAPVPHRATAAEAALVGKPIDEKTAQSAGRAALAGAAPLSKNAYKLPIFETLVRRAILAAAS